VAVAKEDEDTGRGPLGKFAGEGGGFTAPSGEGGLAAGVAFEAGVGVDGRGERGLTPASLWALAVEVVVDGGAAETDVQDGVVGAGVLEEAAGDGACITGRGLEGETEGDE
jgi:hypothetical protein